MVCQGNIAYCLSPYQVEEILTTVSMSGVDNPVIIDWIVVYLGNVVSMSVFLRFIRTVTGLDDDIVTQKKSKVRSIK